MSALEVVVEHAHVLDVGLDRDVVVAVIDPAMRAYADVEVRRIVQRDAIEDQAVGMVGSDQPREGVDVV